jgi:hypothetical protein
LTVQAAALIRALEEHDAWEARVFGDWPCAAPGAAVRTAIDTHLAVLMRQLDDARRETRAWMFAELRALLPRIGVASALDELVHSVFGIEPRVLAMQAAAAVAEEAPPSGPAQHE